MKLILVINTKPTVPFVELLLIYFGEQYYNQNTYKYHSVCFFYLFVSHLININMK